MTVVLVLLVLAVILFATERLPVDVTALLLLGALVITGQLEPREATQGFGSDTVLTIAGLFILSRALLRTGVIERIGQTVARRARGTTGLVNVMLCAVAAVSAFVSNTATTAVFLPVILGISRRTGIPAGRVMMPLAYASILGGTITVIGTSTNLVVAGMLPRYDLEPLGFFELTWVGLPVTVLGMLYLFIVAPRLLPTTEVSIEEQYGLRQYLADLVLDPHSSLAGRTLREAALGREYGLTVVAVERDGETRLAPGPDFRLAPHDKIVVEGPMERLMTARATLGVHIKPERRLMDSLQGGAGRDAVRLVEVVVMPRSPLIGRTLREARFRERFGLSVLALHRSARHDASLSRTRIQLGDVLLVQGPQDRIEALGNRLLVLADVSAQQRETSKAPLAVLLFVGAILASILTAVPLVVTVLVAVALLLALRVISPEEGYAAIEWPVLVLVACMLAFGTAFEESGAAQAVTHLIADVTQPLGAHGLLAAFFLLTVLLTQPMSNQAAALVILPLAIGVAREVGYDPRPFIVAVTIAASNSFVTPLEPSSMLVFGPGRYRFVDFMRVGSGLTLVSFAVSMLVIPWRWPF